MGVDTTLFISNRWNAQDIQQVIEKRFNTKVKLHFHDFAPQYISMQFHLSGNEDRTLNVFTDSELGGFKGISMSFTSNEEGQEVLQTLAKTFGGFFQKSDCDGDYGAFNAPDHGEIAFIVNEAIKSNPALGREHEQMAEYILKEKWKGKL